MMKLSQFWETYNLCNTLRNFFSKYAVFINFWNKYWTRINFFSQRSQNWLYILEVSCVCAHVHT